MTSNSAENESTPIEIERYLHEESAKKSVERREAKRKPRVLLLGPRLDAISGVSTHLNHLLLSGLRDDFDFSVFVVGSEGRQRENSLGKLLRILSSPLTLAVTILRTRPEIVHINVSLDHKSFPRDSVYLTIARLFRRKVVFQVHGGELPADLYKSPFVRDQLVRRVFEAADAVVLLARSELEAYSRFVPGTRLLVIANGIFVDPRAELPQQQHTGPLRLVYVGRLVGTKGVGDCIAAAALLRDAGRTFKLTIAGAGPEEALLKAQADSLVRDGLVEFVGARFGDAKDALWRDSDVFVFPTSHLEGLPYSLLESMAAGAVPITTRMGAQPDVIEEGVHGLFIPPGDPEALFNAIVALDDDRQRLSSLALNAVVRIRRDYSVERLKTDFGNLYRSLLPCPTTEASDECAYVPAET